MKEETKKKMKNRMKKNLDCAIDDLEGHVWCDHLNHCNL